MLLLTYTIIGWIPVVCVMEVWRTQQPVDEIIQLLSVAAMAVFVLGWLTYSWLEYRRYGVSVLRLLAYPAASGGCLEAEIECSLPLDSPAPIVVRVKRQVLLGKPERPQWQTETQVDPREVRRQEGTRSIVPISVPVPDQGPLARRAHGLAPQWVLEISRKTAGIHYHAAFVIPLDEVSDSASDAG